MRDSSGLRRARKADAGRVKFAARRAMTRRIVVGCRILVCHRLFRKLGTLRPDYGCGCPHASLTGRAVLVVARIPGARCAGPRLHSSALTGRKLGRLQRPRAAPCNLERP